jgi:hypothetical protein
MNENFKVAIGKRMLGNNKNELVIDDSQIALSLAAPDEVLDDIATIVVKIKGVTTIIKRS